MPNRKDDHPQKGNLSGDAALIKELESIGIERAHAIVEAMNYWVDDNLCLYATTESLEEIRRELSAKMDEIKAATELIKKDVDHASQLWGKAIKFAAPIVAAILTAVLGFFGYLLYDINFKLGAMHQVLKAFGYN